MAEWPIDAIGAAFKAATGWQAEFWGADRASLPWAGPRMTTADVMADALLWRGLVDDAHARTPDVVTKRANRRRHKLIDTIDVWHPVKDQLSGTLAHNDFNQRNVGFRPELVALDWEIAMRYRASRSGRDADLRPAAIDRLLADHQRTLETLGVDTGLDRDTWMEAFRSELKVEAINRVGMQYIFAAAFPLAFFARINSTIERLLDLYD